jgi:hypothetical protein
VADDWADVKLTAEIAETAEKNMRSVLRVLRGLPFLVIMIFYSASSAARF